MSKNERKNSPKKDSKTPPFEPDFSHPHGRLFLQQGHLQLHPKVSYQTLVILVIFVGHVWLIYDNERLLPNEGKGVIPYFQWQTKGVGSKVVSSLRLRWEMRTPSKCSSYLPFWKQPLSLRAYRHKPKISRKKKVIQTNKPPIPPTLPSQIPAVFLSDLGDVAQLGSTSGNLKKKTGKIAWPVFPPSHGKLNIRPRNSRSKRFSRKTTCNPSYQKRNFSCFFCEGWQNVSCDSDSVKKLASRQEIIPKIEEVSCFSLGARMFCVFIFWFQVRIYRVSVDQFQRLQNRRSVPFPSAKNLARRRPQVPWNCQTMTGRPEEKGRNRGAIGLMWSSKCAEFTPSSHQHSVVFTITPPFHLHKKAPGPRPSASIYKSWVAAWP